jgi:6-O-methylguanine DNA methyltransferase, DNA binding domain
MKSKKSWREKLEADHGLPQVKSIPERMRKRAGDGTIVIPAPREVDDAMRRIPEGKLTTIQLIADALAERHDATIGCTVTSGIFAWIAAHAAHEDELAGKQRITPYWRVLKAKGELNAKYPGGIPALRKRLAAEGHTVVKNGPRFVVKDYETKLAKR